MSLSGGYTNRVHPPPLDSPQLYLNRHASWLAFNRRVLQQAWTAANPLLERVKFLSISASNLDEFFEVHVAGLLQRLEDGHGEPEADGLGLREQRDLISRESHLMVSDQYRCWNEELLPELDAAGIRLLKAHQLENGRRSALRQYFLREMDPLLTPVTIDPAHPFPRVLNKALCLALLLRRPRRNAVYLGVLAVPRALPRVLPLESNGKTQDFVFMADLVALHAPSIYRGYEVLETAAFRVTRNSNLYLQEEESRSLLESVRSEILNRRRGAAVRLEVESVASPDIVERLRENFDLDDWQVFRNEGPVNLPRLFSLYHQAERPELRFPPFVPRELKLSPKAANLFEEMGRGDILLHHPFESYRPVLELLEAAGSDPRVLAVKLTLYRTNEDSPVVRALMAAAQRKSVTVVVELTARFDEASNIRWARTLEDAGVQVFYGVVGLKTHCKMALLVRRDEDGVIRRYAHLGTGNYNPDTARTYTDLSLFTADAEITHAVDRLFTYLTAYARGTPDLPLLVAPADLAGEFLAMIGREADNARAGREACIIAKMNALLDANIIRALYEASQAGVRIELIVRGMCALRPGVRGVSDNINVRSIVGRFLEHSRIYHFQNGGDTQVYLSSADWMPRNLYDRVETAFPVRSEALRRRIREEILQAYLSDNDSAQWLRADGSYVPFSALTARERVRAGVTSRKRFNAQEHLLALATAQPAAAATAKTGRGHAKRPNARRRSQPETGPGEPRTAIS
jgi:polyphosphate kinase